jgi:hypothetical protein
MLQSTSLQFSSAFYCGVEGATLTATRDRADGFGTAAGNLCMIPASRLLKQFQGPVRITFAIKATTVIRDLFEIDS